MPSGVRVTFRSRHPYSTKSNKKRIVRTPGGKHTIVKLTKKPRGPRCGDCGRSLAGIPHLRPYKYAKLSKRQKTVSRAYGGSRCANCVKDRITRAFMVEERKIVKGLVKHEEKKKTTAK